MTQAQQQQQQQALSAQNAYRGTSAHSPPGPVCNERQTVLALMDMKQKTQFLSPGRITPLPPHTPEEQLPNVCSLPLILIILVTLSRCFSQRLHRCWGDSLTRWSGWSSRIPDHPLANESAGVPLETAVDPAEGPGSGSLRLCVGGVTTG